MIHRATLADLRELERLVASPLDPEFEAWRAVRRAFVVDRGRVIRVPRVGGSSFLTGTQTETIYSNSTPGTAKASFTTEAVINDTAGMGPQPILPPYFWQPSANLGVGRALRITARGIYSTTSAPTWQTFVRLGGAASTAGPNIGSTASTALGSSQTNLLWEFEMDAQLTVAGAEGGNSTVRSLGIFTAALTASTSVALGIFGGGASPGTVATVDISITNHINFDAACGTSNASNSIQLLQLFVLGLN